MKAERRQKTDHPARNELGGFRKTVMLGQDRAREPVDPSPNTLDDSSFMKPLKLAPRDAFALKIPGSNQTLPTEKRFDAL